MTHNKAVDLVRREQRRRADQLDEERHRGAQHRRPLPTSWRGCRRPAGRSARRWRSCPAAHREVIELAYFGGYTQSELAEMLSRAHGHHQEPHVRGPEGAASRTGGHRMEEGGSVEHVDELIPAHVLEALDPEETRARGAHICRVPGVHRRAARGRAGRRDAGARAPPGRRRRPSCATACWPRSSPSRPGAEPDAGAPVGPRQRTARMPGWWPRFARDRRAGARGAGDRHVGVEHLAAPRAHEHHDTIYGSATQRRAAQGRHRVRRLRRQRDPDRQRLVGAEPARPTRRG